MVPSLALTISLPVLILHSSALVVPLPAVCYLPGLNTSFPIDIFSNKLLHNVTANIPKNFTFWLFYFILDCFSNTFYQ